MSVHLTQNDIIADTLSGNISNSSVTFSEASTLTDLTSNENLSGIFGKLKLAVKNLKNIISLLGSTDISRIGGGTVTGAISTLNSNLSNTVKTSGKNIIRHDTVGDISAYENGGLIIQSSSGNVPAISLIRQGVSGCAIELYENKDLRVVFNTGETYSINMTRVG